MRVDRSQIVGAIYESDICPVRGCDKPEEEGNTGACCKACAEEILARYEGDVEYEAIEWVRGIIREFVANWNKQSSKKIPKLAAEELDEHILQRRQYREEDEAKQ